MAEEVVSVSETLDPFETIGLVFLSPPANDILGSAGTGKLIALPAIAYHFYDTKAWTNAEQKTAVDIVQLASVAAALGEIHLARKAWRVWLAWGDLAVNAPDFALKNEQVRQQILALPRGGEFLFYWDRCVLIANGVYLSPFAFQFAKGLVSSSVRLSAQLPEIVGKQWQDVNNLFTKLDEGYELGLIGKGVAKTGNEWLLWSQYAKKVIDGEEFAIVGNIYFSKSAIESMIPSGLGGTGIPPSVIDDILTNGEKSVFGGKSYNTSLDAVVITENNGTIVRSITRLSDRTAETSLGLTNSYKATNLEIEAATARIKEVRASGGSAGNYGYLNGEVSKSGVVIDKNKIWASGDANVLLEPQIFDAIEVAGKDGVNYLRNTDSEYKMLNDLAGRLGGTKGNVYTNISGEIKIVSELPFCQSCRGVIKQFNEMFPNIKLIVVNGAK